MMAQLLNPHLANARIPYRCQFMLQLLFFPCLWPSKAGKDYPKPWNPVPIRETPKGLLALGFGSAQLAVAGI